MNRIDEWLLENLGEGSARKVLNPQHISSSAQVSSENVARKFKQPSLSQMLRTASKKKQAVLKITNYGRSKDKIKAHIRYISRHGKLTLEDDNGNLYSELKDQYQVIENWAIDFGGKENSRNTLHLMLSTPPGSDRESAKKAASQFLFSEFGEKGHEYLFVAHSDTHHPHVHAVIKMTSKLGKKLNPKKADLHRMREHWASICRANGIDVEASSRPERGLSGKSTKSAFVQMRRRRCQPNADKKLYEKVKKADTSINKSPISDPIQQKMNQRNQMIRKRYAEKAKELYERSYSFENNDSSNYKKYQKAAKTLDDYAKNMSFENTRQDCMKQQIDKQTEKLSSSSYSSLPGQPVSQTVVEKKIQNEFNAHNSVDFDIDD